MARKRMIDPTIWEDPSFASLPIAARLLFIGLFSNADDEGYLRGDAKGIKRLIFGFDDDMSADATQLLITCIQEKIPGVHVFTVDNQTYIHLSNWFKYQKQQKDRIIGSIFPKCNICLAPAKQVLTQVKLSKVKLSKVSSISTPPKKYSSLKDIQEEDLIQIAQEYKVSLGFVKLQLEKMTNWLGSKGKTYKDYKKGLRNWVLGDMQKSIEKSQGDPTKRGIDARDV